MPFQYTFRADDITTWDATTRDLVENRDRELELSLINLNGANPIGGIAMWAGSVASIPANYILCDGTSYPTSYYPELFAAINYYYGGSGANFLVPDITIPQNSFLDTGRTLETYTTQLTQSTGHVHTLNSHSSTGHSHTLNSHSSTGHTHTLGASTGNGGTDHIHGATTGNASANHQHTANSAAQSANHVHTYFKGNSGGNTTTGLNSANHTHSIAIDSGGATHTHDLLTGASFNYVGSGYLHVHNAAANVNATNADTGHSHTASTTNADTAHTHNADATTADTAHRHDIKSHGVIFIIRYQ